MDSFDIIQALAPWNFWNTRPFIGQKREKYLQRLWDWSGIPEIVVVTGVRRAGKTTLLLQLLDRLIKECGVPAVNTLYINFEDPKFSPGVSNDILQNIVDAYRGFFHPKGQIYIILDEVQMLPEWERWATSVYDRKENIKLFVTGSSGALLSMEFSSLLTGRHLQLEVFPLDLVEYLQFTTSQTLDSISILANSAEIKGYASEFLQSGGFPRVVLEDNENIKKELLRQVYYDILYRDIITKHHVKDAQKLEGLASYLMANISNPMTYSSTKRSLSMNISLETVERFSTYLTSSYLFSFVPVFAFSLKEQMAMPRKVYVIDNGVRQEVSFRFSRDIGRLLENQVYLDLRGDQRDIFYWRGKTETDFVIRDRGRVKELINVCWDPSTPRARDRETRSILESMEHFNMDRGLIITEGFDEVRELNDKQITFIPYWKWKLLR